MGTTMQEHNLDGIPWHFESGLSATLLCTVYALPTYRFLCLLPL